LSMKALMKNPAVVSADNLSRDSLSLLRGQV